MLRQIEQSLFQIREFLLEQENFRKLVYYNTPDALKRAAPSKEEAVKSVYLKPVIYVYEDSAEFGVSTFVSISLQESIILENAIEASVMISVACDREIWEMENQVIRPLAIASEISKLDNFKLGPAGKLQIRVVDKVHFNSELVGYNILLDIYSEKGDVVNEF